MEVLFYLLKKNNSMGVSWVEGLCIAKVLLFLHHKNERQLSKQ